jgi:hypothetical protein
VAAASYAYTGGAEMYYQQYRDADTGKMLVAEPGDPANTYVMVPVDPELNLPVPPGDGRWAEVSVPPPPAGKPPAVQPAQPVTAPEPVPAPAPEGGDE